jgi:hypothetical protein
MNNKIIIYLVIAIGFGACAASLLTLNLYLIAFCSALSLVLIFLYKLWDVFEAIVIRKTNVVQLLGDYEIEAERLTATRSTAKGFSATAAAILKSPPTREISRENIERIIANSNSPFRLVVQAERLDESKIIDNLKTRRRMKEIELSKARAERGDSSRNVIKREIEVLESEIKAIGAGSAPIETNIYLITSAVSDSKFAAQERAVAQAKELSGEFSAVLGAGFDSVSGTELIRLLCLDSLCGVGV